MIQSRVPGCAFSRAIGVSGPAACAGGCALSASAMSPLSASATRMIARCVEPESRIHAFVFTLTAAPHGPVWPWHMRIGRMARVRGLIPFQNRQERGVPETWAWLRWGNAEIGRAG